MTAALKGLEICIAADGLAVDEDLGDRAFAAGSLYQFLASFGIVGDIDLLVFDADIIEEASGHITIGAIGGSVDDDFIHGELQKIGRKKDSLGVKMGEEVREIKLGVEQIMVIYNLRGNADTMNGIPGQEWVLAKEGVKEAKLLGLCREFHEEGGCGGRALEEAGEGDFSVVEVNQWGVIGEPGKFFCQGQGIIEAAQVVDEATAVGIAAGIDAAPGVAVEASSGELASLADPAEELPVEGAGVAAQILENVFGEGCGGA